MKAYLTFFKGRFKQPLIWLGFIAVLAIFFSTADKSYLPNDYDYGFEENYEVVSSSDSAPLECSITQHYPRYKKHYYIAGRKFAFDFFLKNSIEFTQLTWLWNDVGAPLGLQGLSVVFIRPSYYVLLFLHALF